MNLHILFWYLWSTCLGNNFGVVLHASRVSERIDVYAHRVRGQYFVLS
jgi:hypothetical protein